MCKSIPALRISPFDARSVPGTKHLAVNGIPPGICKQQKIALEHLMVISDGAQSQGFQTPSFSNKGTFFVHKVSIKAIKPFALSLLSRSVSFRDLVLCRSIELKQLRLLRNGK